MASMGTVFYVQLLLAILLSLILTGRLSFVTFTLLYLGRLLSGDLEFYLTNNEKRDKWNRLLLDCLNICFLLCFMTSSMCVISHPFLEVHFTEANFRMNCNYMGSLVLHV